MPQAHKGKSSDAAAAWLLRAHRGSGTDFSYDFTLQDETVAFSSILDDIPVLDAVSSEGLRLAAS
jgi:hypothetical protein